jgi:hypothetical protein
MKNLLLPALFVALSGCASLEVTTLYSADSMKEKQCEVAPVNMSVDLYNDSEARLAEFEKYSGYSGCRVEEKSQDTAIIACTSPMPYKMITTKNMARCHQFMSENESGSRP